MSYQKHHGMLAKALSLLLTFALVMPMLMIQASAATTIVDGGTGIIVTTEGEFKTALQNATYKTIYLGANITITSTSNNTLVASRGSDTLVINGTHPDTKVRYALTDYNGAAEASVIGGACRNIMFKDIDLNVRNYYGLYYTAYDSNNHTTITFDGVTGIGAKFYMEHASAEGTFIIRNSELTLSKIGGCVAQEAANCHKVILEGKSSITRANNGQGDRDFFWIQPTGGRVEIADNAEVWFDNTHNTASTGNIFFGAGNFSLIVGKNATFECHSSQAFVQADPVYSFTNVVIGENADVRLIHTGGSHLYNSLHGGADDSGSTFTAQPGSRFFLFDEQTDSGWGGFYFTNIILNSPESFTIINTQDSAIGYKTVNLYATGLISVRYFDSSKVSGIYNVASDTYSGDTKPYTKLWAQDGTFNVTATKWSSSSTSSTAISNLNYSSANIPTGMTGVETTLTNSTFNIYKVYAIDIRGLAADRYNMNEDGTWDRTTDDDTYVRYEGDYIAVTDEDGDGVWGDGTGDLYVPDPETGDADKYSPDGDGKYIKNDDEDGPRYEYDEETGTFTEADPLDDLLAAINAAGTISAMELATLEAKVKALGVSNALYDEYEALEQAYQDGVLTMLIEGRTYGSPGAFVAAYEAALQKARLLKIINDADTRGEMETAVNRDAAIALGVLPAFYDGVYALLGEQYQNMVHDQLLLDNYYTDEEFSSAFSAAVLAAFLQKQADEQAAGEIADLLAAINASTTNPQMEAATAEEKVKKLGVSDALYAEYDALEEEYQDGVLYYLINHRSYGTPEAFVAAYEAALENARLLKVINDADTKGEMESAVNRDAALTLGVPADFYDDKYATLDEKYQDMVHDQLLLNDYYIDEDFESAFMAAVADAIEQKRQDDEAAAEIEDLLREINLSDTREAMDAATTEDKVSKLGVTEEKYDAYEALGEEYQNMVLDDLIAGREYTTKEEFEAAFNEAVDKATQKKASDEASQEARDALRDEINDASEIFDDEAMTGIIEDQTKAGIIGIDTGSSSDYDGLTDHGKEKVAEGLADGTEYDSLEEFEGKFNDLVAQIKAEEDALKDEINAAADDDTLKGIIEGADDGYFDTGDGSDYDGLTDGSKDKIMDELNKDDYDNLQDIIDEFERLVEEAKQAEDQLLQDINTAIDSDNDEGLRNKIDNNEAIIGDESGYYDLNDTDRNKVIDILIDNEETFVTMEDFLEALKDAVNEVTQGGEVSITINYSVDGVGSIGTVAKITAPMGTELTHRLVVKQGLNAEIYYSHERSDNAANENLSVFAIRIIGPHSVTVDNAAEYFEFVPIEGSVVANDRITYGDVNNSGVANAADSAALKNYIDSLGTYPVANVLAGDTTGSGTINTVGRVNLNNYINSLYQLKLPIMLK